MQERAWRHQQPFKTPTLTFFTRFSTDQTMVQKLDHDVVVVGAGLAGLYATKMVRDDLKLRVRGKF
jgi:ribulose 1,5-bisphosphate synthetase/thiazole synthase